MSMLLDTLSRWSAFNVLVVGDFMLDETVYGNADRLSPEAPVPVLHAKRTEARPGGAANLCLDLAAMHAQVQCFGVCGADPAGELLRQELNRCGSICIDGILEDSARPTTRKQRLVGLAQHRHPQAMFRIDYESREPIADAQIDRLIEVFSSALKEADAVCIEDYNKGACTSRLCQDIIALSKRRGVPVLVDPAAISNFARYRGCTVMTPNRTEACLGAGCRVPDDSGPMEFAPVAEHLVNHLDMEAAVITLDRDGALLFERSGTPIVIPTVARKVYDVTGAGDMVLAALTGARCNGLPWRESVRLANIAAGLEVQVFGVKAIPIEEIHHEAMIQERLLSQAGGAPASRVSSLEELLVQLAALRAGTTTRVVFTNGCFDVLHAGHLSILRRAAALGDFLVVAINSDTSVRNLKGPTRPINTQEDRAELLAGLECVGAVVIFDDATPEGLIRAIRPDVLVKGAEYANTAVPGAEFVHSYGGRLELLDMVEGRSTTAVVGRITKGTSASS